MRFCKKKNIHSLPPPLVVLGAHKNGNDVHCRVLPTASLGAHAVATAGIGATRTEAQSYVSRHTFLHATVCERA